MELAAQGAAEATVGMLTENVVPFPAVLFTSMVPPCCSARRLEMARPSPVPWCFFASVLSPWTKGWNKRGMRA